MASPSRREMLLWKIFKFSDMTLCLCFMQKPQLLFWLSQGPALGLLLTLVSCPFLVFVLLLLENFELYLSRPLPWVHPGFPSACQTSPVLIHKNWRSTCQKQTDFVSLHSMSFFCDHPLHHFCHWGWKTALMSESCLSHASLSVVGF